MAEEQTNAATPEQLYRAVLKCWNVRNAAGFAGLFESEGHSIGFDGSEMHGPEEIESALGEIFADHETAAYVAKIREVRLLTPELALLGAVVGMVPAGQDDLDPDKNAVQTLVAKRHPEGWRVALLQNTPAQYHGRPEVAEALTAELRDLL
ncbi:MAG TPA: SgcJ/EcaC family oxidoreductase [Gaiellaceae bacterium]|nr:SgcJ/EcaC family oxidoreductase [Gaiellaceae bacterium]